MAGALVHRRKLGQVSNSKTVSEFIPQVLVGIIINKNQDKITIHHKQYKYNFITDSSIIAISMVSSLVGVRAQC